MDWGNAAKKEPRTSLKIKEAGAETFKMISPTNYFIFSHKP
jgi:hypothetical protein